ncbi:hypothetical protein [Nocardia sp. NPDC050710]|uniref:hypothetical protein n=1 Tax=Nocardia sp. NPDC050710 TaxID=3157220 RepID=UPI0034021033
MSALNAEPVVGSRIDYLAPLHDPTLDPGAVLARIPSCAADFRAEFRLTGTPDSIDTYDLITLPYPTRFGLWRASMAPAPFLSITNRMLIVRWTEADGRRRTLLFEPSDVELGTNTPYFAALARRTPGPLETLFVRRHRDVLAHLRSAGIDPAEIDYLVFDHLHTQDVRRWLGTTEPQPDLGAVTPLEPIFPNARLLVQRSELNALDHLHPQQRPWYQPDTYRDLRPEAITPVDGDLLLGPGVALIATPGHTTGNQTLVLNTDTGIWASSENAIAAECLVPRHSKLLGVRRWAQEWDQGVVVNANTVETIAAQYNSLILERSIVDVSQRDSRFPQFFPSSELTRRWTNPGTAPTFVHEHITHRGGRKGTV